MEAAGGGKPINTNIISEIVLFSRLLKRIFHVPILFSIFTLPFSRNLKHLLSIGMRLQREGHVQMSYEGAATRMVICYWLNQLVSTCLF